MSESTKANQDARNIDELYEEETVVVRYASTAFTSSVLPDLRPAAYEHDGKFYPCTSLPWEHKPDPAKLRRCIALGNYGLTDRFTHITSTGNEMRFPMHSSRLHPAFYFMLCACFAWIIAICVYFFSQGMPSIWVLIPTIALFVLTVLCLLLDRQQITTFCRSSGMVSVGRSEDSNEVSVFFYECDPYIVKKTSHGTSVYKLGLRPRNMDRLNEPWIIFESSVQEDIYVIWHCIQMFMDTSRPLPDIPIFEPYRASDPRTIRHDLSHQREAHYWADKSREEHQDLLNKAIQQFPTVKPVWPCLISEHIKGRDPTEQIHVKPV